MSDKTWYPGCATGRLLSCTPSSNLIKCRWDSYCTSLPKTTFYEAWAGNHVICTNFKYRRFNCYNCRNGCTLSSSTPTPSAVHVPSKCWKQDTPGNVRCRGRTVALELTTRLQQIHGYNNHASPVMFAVSRNKYVHQQALPSCKEILRPLAMSEQRINFPCLMTAGGIYVQTLLCNAQTTQDFAVNSGNNPQD